MILDYRLSYNNSFFLYIFRKNESYVDRFIASDTLCILYFMKIVGIVYDLIQIIFTQELLV